MMLFDQITAIIVTLEMLIDTICIVWYWRKRDHALTILGTALPLLWLSINHLLIVTHLINPTEAKYLIRLGLLWLGFAVMAHFATVAIKNHVTHNGP